MLYKKIILFNICFFVNLSFSFYSLYHILIFFTLVFSRYALAYMSLCPYGFISALKRYGHGIISKYWTKLGMTWRITEFEESFILLFLQCFWAVLSKVISLWWNVWIRNVLPFSTLPNNATSSPVLLGYPVLSTSFSGYGKRLPNLVNTSWPWRNSRGIWANQTEKYFEWVLIYDGEERTVCKNCAAASLYTVAWLTYFRCINIWQIFISNYLVVEMWVGTWDRLGQPTNQSNEIPRNCLCAWAKRLMLRRKATHRWNVIEANTYSVVLECGSSCTFSISKVQCVDLENKM